MKIGYHFNKNLKGEIIEIPILEPEKVEINNNMHIIGTKGKSVNIKYDEKGNRYLNGKLEN